jgi:hypothetical protein
MAQHLTDEGFETVEAMFEHAKHQREKQSESDAVADVMKLHDETMAALRA